ncbi:MAG: NeuD/PglB/VioB family sugar acetyltransferase [Magnetococcales bacterium]|nr:NeuD/PglB/VioB family sugar acetyltransferase [Magnetococcales bacterium]MBF0156076.1 NeuD/PglB/VioB family sugar acetyltransferase [Magnetococcales bacterium]
MVRNIVILGTGGNSIDILDTLLEINRQKRIQYHCLGFLDDAVERHGQELLGHTILGPLAHARELKDCFFVNGIGNEKNFWLKEEIIARTGVAPERFATILHPSASVSRSSSLGFGTVVFQNVSITSRVAVGDHVIILPNAVISHDDRIGDFTCIAGGTCISGGVSIGRSCYLGSHCAIKDGLSIGDRCLIGMGSVVLQSVEANQVMVGNPARRLRNTC